MGKTKIFKKIKNFIIKHFQIITKGYSYEDMWSLDFSISKMIIPRLKEFRSMDKTGYPANMESMEEWNKVLDDILFAFEYTVCDLYDNCGFDTDYLKNEKRRRKGLKLFAENFNHLWD